MTSTVFLDESGWTGEDLANVDQPVFVLATLQIEEDEARELKATLFSGIQAPELKHSLLGSRASGQRRVLGFLNHMQADANLASRVHFWLVHKEFALATKMVEWVLEPSVHKAGLDLYRNGGNLGFANLFYAVLNVAATAERRRSILLSFQEMIRERDGLHLRRLRRALQPPLADAELDEVLGYMRKALWHLGPEVLDIAADRPLDLGVTGALRSMAIWRQRRPGPLILIHDASTAFAKERHIWDVVVDPSFAPPGSPEYPIALTDTRLESSAVWCGLQLADVLAGSAARWARWRIDGQKPEDSYGQQLHDVLRRAEFTISDIWPSTKVTPEELGTVGRSGKELDAFADSLSAGLSARRGSTDE